MASPPASSGRTSGGKILSLRRYRRPDASPYSRSQASPRWSLGGLISSAGKLISAVLPYNSSQTTSSTYSSSDYDEDSTEDEDEDVHVFHSKEHRGSDEREKDPQFDNNFVDGVTLKSKSKQALVQLLMKETFSRDECDNLIKLIKSRVVDIQRSEVRGDSPRELPYQNYGISSPGDSGFFQKSQKLLGTSPYSSSKLNVFSHPSPAYKEQTFDMCNRAVMEAKKWFEAKKLASSSKYDSECGPCTLNTEARLYDTESEQGSPVDTAKSYMRSLPPWRSPLSSSEGFKTPSPPSVTLLQYKKRSCSADQSSFLSKVLKIDHTAIRSWDTPEGTRNVGPKATLESHFSKSKEMESSARVSEHDYPNLSVKAVERDLLIGDNCCNGAPQTPIDKSEQEKELEIIIITSGSTVSDPEETTNAQLAVNGSATPEPTCELDNSKSAKDVGNEQFNVLKDAENTSSTTKPVEQQTEIIPLPDEDHISVPTASKHDDMSEGKTSQIPTVSDEPGNGSFSEVTTNLDHKTLSKKTSIAAGNSTQNGTTMKSIEKILAEPQPSETRRRRRKKVAVAPRKSLAN